MSQQAFVYGAVNDTDQDLKSKVGGQFGLNPGVFFSKIAFNPNAGKDGAAANAVEISVKVGDREYNQRVYEITGDLYNSKNELVSPGEEGYDALFAIEAKQRAAVIIHAVKSAGVTQEQINAALATPAPNFAAWAEIVCGLLSQNYTQNPIDVFLHYQWNIKEGQERTYLELPKNMKGGRFFAPAVAKEGDWNPVNDNNGLRYVDAKGQEHPFVRSANYMESERSYQQVEGEDNGPAAKTNGAFAEGGKESTKKSTW